jgi:hypothetical protein
MPHINGALKDQHYKYQEEVPDAQGIKRKQKVEGSCILIAKWHAGSSGNRMTAPDVQPGETVQIYRFADTDRYYWDTQMREPELRRQEHVVHAYCNLKSGTKAFDASTSYWTEVDTKNKKVRLHTAKNDGEPFGYDVIFDTKKGTVTLKDTDGNTIYLESKTGTIKVTAQSHVIATSNGNTMHINGSSGDISISAKSKVNISAGSQIHISAPDIYTHGNVHD